MRTPAFLVHAGRFTRETFRDPVLLVTTLVLGLAFMGLCALAYPRDPYPRPVLVVFDQDALHDPAFGQLRTRLDSLRTPDGRPAVRTSAVPLAAPDTAGNTAALAGGADLELRRLADGSPGLRADALSVWSIHAMNLVEQAQDTDRPEPVLEQAPLPYLPPRNDFETFTPGMMVFTILMMIPMTAVIISRDRRRGTMNRLRLAGAGSTTCLAGLALSQILSALILGLALMAGAVLAGFPLPERDPWLAFLQVELVLAVLSLGSVAQGLFLGAWVGTDTAALMAGQSIGMLQVFLSGSFFAMPAPVLFASGDWSIRLWDFLPPVHGRDALALTLGGSWGQASGPLLACLIWALIWFAAAIPVFRRPMTS